METKKRCLECRELIEPKDHQVCLITKNNGEFKEKVYFHINCWSKYFNKAVTNKAKQGVSAVQDKFKGIMENPMLKGLLGSFGGTDKLKEMMETPLDEIDLDATMEKLGLNKSKKNPKKKSVKKKTNGKKK
jgi:hypothetical protein